MLPKKRRVFPFSPAGKVSFLRSFCQATSCPLWFSVTAFFSVCSQLRQEEKCLSRPFVFKKFPASLTMSIGGHRVAMESVWGEAKYVTTIHPFLLREPDGAAGDQAEVPQGSGRPTTTLKSYSSLSYLICQAKSFVGKGVIGNRIPFETPFMRAKANPVLIAQKKVHIEGEARRGCKPRASYGLGLPCPRSIPRPYSKARASPPPMRCAKMAQYGAFHSEAFRCMLPVGRRSALEIPTQC